MCMATQPTPSSAATAPCERRRTSLTSVAPAAMAASGDRRLAGVDRDPDAVGGQRLDHRDDPAQLLGLVDRRGAGPGGLAADVDHVGALGDQAPAVGDGGVGVEEAAAVGERVGGHVEDAHDERTAEHAGSLGQRLTRRFVAGPSSPFERLAAGRGVSRDR